MLVRYWRLLEFLFGFLIVCIWCWICFLWWVGLRWNCFLICCCRCDWVVWWWWLWDYLIYLVRYFWVLRCSIVVCYCWSFGCWWWSFICWYWVICLMYLRICLIIVVLSVGLWLMGWLCRMLILVIGWMCWLFLFIDCVLLWFLFFGVIFCVWYEGDGDFVKRNFKLTVVDWFVVLVDLVFFWNFVWLRLVDWGDCFRMIGSILYWVVSMRGSMCCLIIL